MKTKTKRYVCIHGHFYQPPRENPWLNRVEIQDSAYPYHDWNHRINAECYARNTASRILNGDHKILDIINNYSWISFNFGPTLLNWMESEAPKIYQAILKADKDSQDHFNGHGSAIAQAYNHMIMPLANRRDKETQVRWGIADFVNRFDRPPEGMWLGETAVDNETLEILAENNIKFTILSPYQARQFRKIGEKKWHDATHAQIETKRAYMCKLPSGKSINIFFYGSAASQGVAFEGLLNNGEEFASRLLDQFSEEQDPQLVHIATDGESYGHHHRLGEMALSYCLHSIQEYHPRERLTVYGEFLELHPPEYEVEILENTSWSCYHGVERWRSDCGCNTGGHKDWNQKWRKPLRETFDWLRDQLISFYEKEMQPFTSDPWAARNDYIRVVQNRSHENVSEYLKQQFGEKPIREEQVKILKLLEMQHHCMLMYTSCGWFFDEVTGIESMQDIFYATRALQLAEDISDQKFEVEFEKRLGAIPSNVKRFGNAATAYDLYVKPMVVDMMRVGAHFAVSSLFEEFPQQMVLYSFNTNLKRRNVYQNGKQRLVVGRALIQSQVTWEEIDISYAVLHLGEHNLFGGVRPYLGNEALDEMHQNISDAFDKGRVYEVFNLMDKYFGSHSYSFWHLFRDDQRKIMKRVSEQSMHRIESTIYELYENNFTLLQVYREINMRVPPQLQLPMELALNTQLINLFKKRRVHIESLRHMLESAKKVDVDLDLVTLNYLANKRMEKEMRRLENQPESIARLEYMIELISLIKELGLAPELWEVQNSAYFLRNHSYDNLLQKAEAGDQEARTWCDQFDQLYKSLNLVI